MRPLYAALACMTLQTAGWAVSGASSHLIQHRQSFYLGLRLHRNCFVSDNSVCVREKEKEVIFCRESSQSSLLSSEPGWITTINKEESECFAGFSLTELSW